MTADGLLHSGVWSLDSREPIWRLCRWARGLSTWDEPSLLGIPTVANAAAVTCPTCLALMAVEVEKALSRKTGAP